MGFIRETFLICDGRCGETYGVDDRTQNYSAKELRRKAKKFEEWVYRKGEDLCCDCKYDPTENEKEHYGKN